MFVMENTRFTLIGVASSGPSECGEAPGIFIKITNDVKNWIMSKTEGTQDNFAHTYDPRVDDKSKIYIKDWDWVLLRLGTPTSTSNVVPQKINNQVNDWLGGLGGLLKKVNINIPTPKVDITGTGYQWMSCWVSGSMCQPRSCPGRDGQGSKCRGEHFQIVSNKGHVIRSCETVGLRYSYKSDQGRGYWLSNIDYYVKTMTCPGKKFLNIDTDECRSEKWTITAVNKNCGEGIEHLDEIHLSPYYDRSGRERSIYDTVGSFAKPFTNWIDMNHNFYIFKYGKQNHKNI